MADEPVPLSTLFIARGRALAALARPDAGAEDRAAARAALKEVAAEARRAGFWTALEGLEEAAE